MNRMFLGIAAAVVLLGAAFVYTSSGSRTMNEPQSKDQESAKKAPAQGNSPVSSKDGLAKATFGGGCFWCTEAVFQQLKGVESVVSGYSGGQVANPTYKQVCTGDTGHAEVIQITYDPKQVAFD